MTNESYPELRPCPFCGGEAKLYVSDGVRIICLKCRAATKTLIDEYNGFEIRTNAVRSVIEAWNRRVDDV